MKRQSLWIMVICLILLVSACGRDKKDQDKDKSTNNSNANTENKNITIKLVQNAWLASEVNVMVAKILLEERLGYTVEIIKMDEPQQWEALVAGDVHGVLEVWPSGHKENRAKYIDQDQTVEYGGELGPVGKIGWYVPTYVLRAYPELTTWEGFQNAEDIALFADENSSGKGVFIAGDPTWVQFETDIINNLALDLVVRPVEVVEGSDAESTIITMVDAAYTEEKPILFYFWTPHWIHAKYDLEQVTLPPYTEECYSADGGVACAYPDDVFFKIFWTGLKDYAADAHQFLRNFEYSNIDQISMMAAVQIQNRTVEEAAREWIEKNEETWKVWLP